MIFVIVVAAAAVLTCTLVVFCALAAGQADVVPCSACGQPVEPFATCCDVDTELIQGRSGL